MKDVTILIEVDGETRTVMPMSYRLLQLEGPDYLKSMLGSLLKRVGKLMLE